MKSRKKCNMIFRKWGGGAGRGQRPFGTFPKIHPFWSCQASLRRAIYAFTCSGANMAENGRFLAPIELELTRRQNEHQILAWMGILTMPCGIFPWKLFLCENNSLGRDICPPQQSSCHPLSPRLASQKIYFSNLSNARNAEMQGKTSSNPFLVSWIFSALSWGFFHW